MGNLPQTCALLHDSCQKVHRYILFLSQSPSLFNSTQQTPCPLIHTEWQPLSHQLEWTGDTNWLRIQMFLDCTSSLTQTQPHKLQHLHGMLPVQRNDKYYFFVQLLITKLCWPIAIQEYSFYSVSWSMTESSSFIKHTSSPADILGFLLIFIALICHVVLKTKPYWWEIINTILELCVICSIVLSFQRVGLNLRLWTSTNIAFQHFSGIKVFWPLCIFTNWLLI